LSNYVLLFIIAAFLYWHSCFCWHAN